MTDSTSGSNDKDKPRDSTGADDMSGRQAGEDAGPASAEAPTAPVQQRVWKEEEGRQDGQQSREPASTAKQESAPSGTPKDKSGKSKPASGAANGKTGAKLALNPPSWLLPAGAGALVLGLLLLAFFALEQDKAIDTLFSEYNAVLQERDSNRNRIASLQETISTLEDELRGTRETLAEQSSVLDTFRMELANTRLRVNNAATGDNQRTLLVEANSLLRLAQQRLIVGKDLRSAIALFVAADDILEQIDDSAVFSIREVLAADLAALRAVREVDVQEPYLELGAVIEQIPELPLVSGSDYQFGNAEEVRIADPAAEDGGFFGQVMGRLQQYITVRRLDGPLRPLLTDEQAFYIKQNIRVLLEQARLGMLREETQIVRDNLRQAMALIEEFLSSESQARSNILSTLEALARAEYVQPVPSVSATLQAIQRVLSAGNGSGSGNAADEGEN